MAGTRPGRDVIYLAHVVIFAIAAIGLARTGREDRRALRLALLFLLVSSLFADRLLLKLAGPFPAAGIPLLLLGHAQVEAFLPYILWLFVGDFPWIVVPGWSRRLQRMAIPVSIGVGITFLGLNLAYAAALVGGWESPFWRVAAQFSRFPEGTHYQAILFVVMLPALPLLVWKAGRAQADERRRVWLLLGGFVAGSAPMLITVVVMNLSSAAAAALSRPHVLRVLEVIVYAGTLSIPLTTAYAVLVQHALDVRLVVRKAVRYALAQYTVVILAVAPLVVLLVLLFVNRDKSLAAIMTGPVGLVLMATGALGVVMLTIRHRVVEGIDRRFFREQYDTNQILHALIEGSRNVPDVAALEALLLREIDRALHVEQGALLVRMPDSEQLVSPSHRLPGLSVTSELAQAVLTKAGGISVELAHPDPRVEALPLRDLQWLAEGGVRLLLPLVRSSGDLVGALALGGKRSELPFTREDRLLLATLASSAAGTLEDRVRAMPRVEAKEAGDRAGVECVGCGAVAPPGEGRCAKCGGPMETSKVPHILRAKFRFEQRIGKGGMGVVYRATDLDLGRQVAIKTLPWVAPYLAILLRREARAMAAVSHPNLAMIHGVEFFEGIPMLVVEYLPGGTLADRLRDGPIPWREAVTLGIILAEAADRIHEAGILHRDIKPSNVGFTADGTPKLLDFGLARTIEAADELQLSAPWAVTGTARAAPSDGSGSAGDTFTGGVAGTAAYLSPEAIRGQPPDPSFDLWSLAMVVYEAIAGANPVLESQAGMSTKPASVQIPDIRSRVPGCPAALAEFLREALHQNRKRRPASGKAFARQLRSLVEM